MTSSRFFVVAAVVAALARAQAPIPVDLSAWTVESYPTPAGIAAANWIVAADGLSVVHGTSGPPTILLADTNAFGSPLTLNVTATNAGDDDHFGFVLGFDAGDASDPAADYLLVDWKRAAQTFDFGAPACGAGTTAARGLAISRVFGIPTADELWGHQNQNAAPCSDLASGVVELGRGATLGAVGWNPFATYAFTFEIGPSNAKVYVNGALELNVAPPAGTTFADGKVGFYNFSQAAVQYAATQPASSLPPPPPPTLNFVVAQGSLHTIPAAPAVGQQTVLSAKISNVGSLTGTVRADFYAGNPALGGTLLGQESRTLLPGGAWALDEWTFDDVVWTPGAAGPTTIYVVAVNQTGGVGETNLEDNAASIVVYVDPPPEALEVSAAEVVVWPGTTFQTTVLVRNVGLGAATIASFAIQSPWATPVNDPTGATLAPGASETVIVDVAVPPGTPGGAPGFPPTAYGLLVVVQTATASFSDPLVVKVFAQQTTTAIVEVRDAVSGATLSGADVAVSGVPLNYVTDSVGRASVPLPPGPRGFFAYKSGYVATAINADVASSGATLVVIALEPGQTLAVQQITQTQLTTQQIFDRGISALVPENNIVIDFTVSLQIGTVTVPSVFVPVELPPGGFSFTATVPAPPSSPIPDVQISATFVPNVYGRQETWIVIPGSVTILKQFWEVSMLVKNNAVAPSPSDVQIAGGSALLTVPSGIGLPDLNGVPQVNPQTVPTLNAGEEANLYWVVRGDLPGTYQLTGSVTGTLFAFGQQIATLGASATSPPFEVATPNVRLEFGTPTSVTAGAPFNFSVAVTNQGAATLNYVRVSLKVENLVNCVLAPPSMQPRNPTYEYDPFGGVTEIEVVLGDIVPAETKTATFVLVSLVTGDVIQKVVEISAAQFVAPDVAVAPRYAGTAGDADPATGDDCLLLTGLDSPRSGTGLKLAYPGATLGVHVSSPNGTYVGRAVTLAAKPFASGSPPSVLASGVHTFDGDPLATVFVFDGLPWSIQTPEPLLAGGNLYEYLLPPFTIGYSIMVQFLVVYFDANGLHYCASDGHELMFR